MRNLSHLKKGMLTALFVLLLGITKVMAQTITVNNLIIKLNSFNHTTATVMGHVDGTNATGSLDIPSTVDYITYETINGQQVAVTHTYIVTEFNVGAFYGCTGLTGSLIIPNTVTSITSLVFYGCTGFNGNLVIGNSVTSIGIHAFQGCSGFTGLTIPNSVTSIGSQAFYGCSGFTGNLTIPSSVTSIGSGAFYGCSSFNGVLTIPASVTSIGETTFFGCSGFAEVHYNATNCGDVTNNGSAPPFKECGGTLSIGENVERIPMRMFSNAFFTGNLTIPNSVISIGDNAFTDCSGFIGDLTIPNSVTSIGYAAFYGCSGFTGNLTIGNSVISIDDYAFRNCNGFTGSLTIGNSVATIGIYAFENCSGFTGDLIIPDSVTSIGKYAFQGCSGFNGSLTIGNSLTSIDQYVFKGCNGFTGDLVIPDSATSIGQYAFQGCSGFNGSLTIGNSVTSIAQYAFSGCNGFTGDLIFPDSVTSIGGYSFQGCSGFTGDLTFGNSVTSIGSYIGCSGFTGILTIGNSVTSISHNAFSSCKNFSEVHYNAINCGGSNYQYKPFSGFSGTLIIGEEVEVIPSYMFQNANFTGGLTIPNSVTEIGDGAFMGCNGLTSMDILAETPPTIDAGTFPNSLKSIPVYVPCGSLEAYQSADYWNEFTNMQEQCVQSQAVTLPVGWNWWSTNLDITLDDLKNALVTALGSNTVGTTIKSKDRSVTYNGSIWRGTLNTLDVTRMYKFFVGAACEITLSGIRINPAAHPITIQNGANWIAFPLVESMSPTNAFDGFAVEGDMVRSKTTSSTYNGSTWRGTLKTLVPGQGYIYKSNETNDRILTFPSGMN